MRTISLIAVLLAFPVQAVALDSSEFHLYGINKAGSVFDITPYGDESVGDPESEGGFNSQMVRWFKRQEVGDLQPRTVCTANDAVGKCVRRSFMQPVGRCTVRLKPAYTLSCESGAMSGMTFRGEGLDATGLRAMPDADSLYKSFQRRYEGARPVVAARYRCQEGCKSTFPATLIFLWLGD